MTDMFVLLQLPNAGDDLQAIKKGVMELADLVVVNKSDLDPAAAARAVGQIESALHLVARRAGDAWTPKVMATSALVADQVAAVWQVVASFRAAQQAHGAFGERRRGQARAWLWERIDSGLRQSFRAHPQVRAQLADTLAAVEAGRLPVSVAARRLLTSAGVDAARISH
jgi:LAO/AO transport system kinase